MKKILIATAVALSLAGCATSRPDVVYRGDTQRMAYVQDATIVSMRPVTVEGSQTGMGAMAGGMVGSVAGGGVGGNWRDRQAGSVIGMIAGALIGHAVERGATTEQAYEILVQLRNGERRSIVQTAGPEALNPGDAVVLTTSNGRTRVTRAAQAPEPYKS